MLIPLLSRVLRLVSIVACLIAIASFATFVIDQSGSASDAQQAKVNETSSSSNSKGKGKSGLHEAIDKAFSTLSSPFSGITSSTSSRWTIEIVDTLLVLIVYGFGLSFLARLLPGRL